MLRRRDQRSFRTIWDVVRLGQGGEGKVWQKVTHFEPGLVAFGMDEPVGLLPEEKLETLDVKD